ncbi:MAG: L,D-transpeptidase, partial [Ruminococcus sp.]|nr:L,D-transpeptidase [Ruminococcus sp.]
ENFFNTVRLTPGTKYYFRIQPYKINGASRTKVVGTWSVEQQTITTGAFGKSVGGTYVEISIDQQYMWLYVDRKLIVETDVVTGNDDGYCNTPRGAFNINSRARNTYLNGAGYSSFVNYWMGFYGGCGIHDASWRSSYGGHIYQGNGSHGCVNTPYSKVQKIYNWTEYGTPVIVY